MTLEEDKEENVLLFLSPLGLNAPWRQVPYRSKWTRGFCSKRYAGSSVPSRLTPPRLLDQATALRRHFASCLGGMVKRSLCRACRPRPSKPLAVPDQDCWGIVHSLQLTEMVLVSKAKTIETSRLRGMTQGNRPIRSPMWCCSRSE